MQSVSFSDLRRHLSTYLDQVAKGDEIVVTSRGRPIARLVPSAEQPPVPRPVGLLAGRIRIAGDFDDTPAELVLAMESGAE
ncbi:Prevent-host-death protein [Magnetospirillum sp. LM-5]|uniref:type II toxin-antitoxin system Phd/YefM family antitoxin n=1 Tax=Magnetospirillum sp. LM-5 TaxID=2681466 RepID=UPI0013850B0A|nr:type II toxin-antitoxin system prevent-host-death family antitoxin [Magnetospirillum sp. LM-5]CAA7620209.1 Prevent-host-death protein [Magnetospirillum sp. LM-5]